MNKFIALAVFACVASVALAQPDDPFTELAVVPNDQEEIKYLKEENKIFSDYCIKSRDIIKNFIASSANNQASEVFEAIFSSVNDIGSMSLQNQEQAITISAEAIGSQVNDQTLMQLLIEGAKAALRALFDTARTQLFVRIEALKTQFTAEGLKDKISAACNSISYGLKQKLEESLAQTRNQMKVSASKMGPEGQAMLDTITKARFDNIGCLTIGRASKVQKFCDILNVAGSSIYPLLGL